MTADAVVGPSQALVAAATKPIPWTHETRLAQALKFLYNPMGYAVQLADSFGPVVGIRPYALGPLVFVTRPDLIKAVFADRRTWENYSGTEVLAPLIGANGTILLEGERHLRRRKLVNPPFLGSRLARWADIITEIADREIDTIPRELPVPMRPVMQRITVEVICRVVFGVSDPDTLQQLGTVIAQWANPKFALPLMFPLLRADLGTHSPWGGLQRAKQDLLALIDDAITDAQHHPDPHTRDDVLSMLVHATDDDGNAGYTHEELQDELLGLLFAGHDTTASALAWSCVLLADHPDEWDRLVTETRSGTTEYTDAVFNEVLRLKPSVVAAGRYATCDTELGDYRVPKGTRVGTLTLPTRDAKNFPEPEMFQPSRWLDGPSRQLSPRPRSAAACTAASAPDWLHSRRASCCSHSLARPPGWLPHLVAQTATSAIQRSWFPTAAGASSWGPAHDIRPSAQTMSAFGSCCTRRYLFPQPSRIIDRPHQSGTANRGVLRCTSPH